MGGQWSSDYDANAPVDLRHFKLGRSIGRGAFGKVKVVVKRDTKKLYALKYINKDQCIKKRAYRNIIRERNLLENISFPTICNLRFAFQDDENMFMVLDLMLGGDLRFHINRMGKFTERMAVFYAAELAAALMYLHSRRVIHRDIKPDNILLDGDGHAHLTDFNCATILEPGKKVTSETGTQGYMAPEVYGNVGYSEAVDWWSLGIVLWECLHGERPFAASRVDKLVYKVKTQPITYSEEMSRRMRSLLEGFLQRDPRERLGIAGAGHADLMAHSAFKRIDWDLLQQKEIEPPFVPDDRKLNFDARYELEEILLEENPLHAKPRKKDPSSQSREMRIIESEFLPFDYMRAHRAHDPAFHSQVLLGNGTNAAPGSTASQSNLGVARPSGDYIRDHQYSGHPQHQQQQAPQPGPNGYPQGPASDRPYRTGAHPQHQYAQQYPQQPDAPDAARQYKSQPHGRSRSRNQHPATQPEEFPSRDRAPDVTQLPSEYAPAASSSSSRRQKDKDSKEREQRRWFNLRFFNTSTSAANNASGRAASRRSAGSSGRKRRSLSDAADLAFNTSPVLPRRDAYPHAASERMPTRSMGGAGTSGRSFRTVGGGGGRLDDDDDEMLADEPGKLHAVHGSDQAATPSPSSSPSPRPPAAAAATHDPPPPRVPGMSSQPPRAVVPNGGGVPSPSRTAQRLAAIPSPTTAAPSHALPATPTGGDDRGYESESEVVRERRWRTRESVVIDTVAAQAAGVPLGPPSAPLLPMAAALAGAGGLRRRGSLPPGQPPSPPDTVVLASGASATSNMSNQGSEMVYAAPVVGHDDDGSAAAMAAAAVAMAGAVSPGLPPPPSPPAVAQTKRPQFYLDPATLAANGSALMIPPGPGTPPATTLPRHPAAALMASAPTAQLPPTPEVVGSAPPPPRGESNTSPPNVGGAPGSAGPRPKEPFHAELDRALRELDSLSSSFAEQQQGSLAMAAATGAES
ncbi:hypothetical protein H9P43_002379 [Blastocladiella emersonii ATCC 22665]|nr:hypothetical protein H9P43_002379 [Blastocladiella emersonii ATCC 22665]